MWFHSLQSSLPVCLSKPAMSFPMFCSFLSAEIRKEYGMCHNKRCSFFFIIFMSGTTNGFNIAFDVSAQIKTLPWLVLYKKVITEDWLVFEEPVCVQTEEVKYAKENIQFLFNAMWYPLVSLRLRYFSILLRDTSNCLIVCFAFGFFYNKWKREKCKWNFKRVSHGF